MCERLEGLSIKVAVSSCRPAACQTECVYFTVAFLIYIESNLYSKFSLDFTSC